MMTKKYNKIVSIILITTIIFSTIVSIPSFYANTVGVHEEKENSEWQYSVSYTSETVLLMKYIGSDSTVTIPTSIDNYPITNFSTSILKNTTVKELIIPDMNTPIKCDSTTNRECFANSTNLEKVTIGSMFANGIPKSAFENCNKLKTVNFTDDFTKKLL